MRRIFALTVAALGAAVLFAAGLGLGAAGDIAVPLKAKLAARYETPAAKGATRAAGVFTATLSNRGQTLSWRLTFSRLTGKALAAHIHLGKPGVAGPVAIPLCGPCASGAHGNAAVTPKVRSALLNGGAYVNVHTARNAAGEIRGQVSGGGGNVAPAATVGAGGATTTSDGGYGGYG